MHWLVVVFCAAFVACRIAAGVLLPALDCDEIYNYWEPARFLVFGRGKQTWEYAPPFALRSWLFVWLYAWPAQLLKYLGYTDELLAFTACKAVLSAVGAATELALGASIGQRFGAASGALALLTLVASPGATSAVTSFLPSAFALVCNNVVLALWLWIDRLPATGRPFPLLFAMVFASCGGVVVGWPFAGLLLVPVGLAAIVQDGLLRPLLALVQSLIVLGTAVLFTDTVFYGRLVFSPWRLVEYNVFGAKGPELYGVEPPSFFVKNLAVNFNVAFAASLLFPAMLLLSALFGKSAKSQSTHQPKRKAAVQASSPPSGGRLALYVLPFWLWFGFWLLIPHKEERFMYPAYPFLVLGAVLAVRAAGHGIGRRWGQVFFLAFAFATLLLGAARLSAVYANYSGVQRALTAARPVLSQVPAAATGGDRMLCLGLDWYRFPSGFFLPQSSSTSNATWNYCFVKTQAFSGALPLDFIAANASHPGANDDNREIPQQYCNVAQCDAVVDSLPAHEAQQGQWALFEGAVTSRAFTTVLGGNADHRIIDADGSGFFCRVLHPLGLVPSRCAWRTVVVALRNGLRGASGSSLRGAPSSPLPDNSEL